VFLTIWIAIGLAWCSGVQQPSRSALESDPAGWVDLIAERSLKNWVRVPMGPVGTLPAGKAEEPSPWAVNAAGDTLACDGAAAGHEMLRLRTEHADFILHVEWRFTKLEGDPPYNSGVFVRTAADATTWIQAQTGAAGGYLFGSYPSGGAVKRFNLRPQMTENRVKPAGEWNVYEIRADGKALSLWVNGAIVNQYDECEALSGHVGLEAEGYRIEFRNVKLKALR
jgi:hypothetical protein